MDTFTSFDVELFFGSHSATTSASSSSGLPVSSASLDESKMFVDYEVRSGCEGPTFYCIIAWNMCCSLPRLNCLLQRTIWQVFPLALYSHPSLIFLSISAYSIPLACGLWLPLYKLLRKYPASFHNPLLFPLESSPIILSSINWNTPYWSANLIPFRYTPVARK